MQFSSEGLPGIKVIRFIFKIIHFDKERQFAREDHTSVTTRTSTKLAMKVNRVWSGDDFHCGAFIGSVHMAYYSSWHEMWYTRMLNWMDRNISIVCISNTSALRRQFFVLRKSTSFRVRTNYSHHTCIPLYYFSFYIVWTFFSKSFLIFLSKWCILHCALK